MKTEALHYFKREQWIDRPLEEVFPFFERPENLALITPPSLDFRLMTPAPVSMEQGRIIDYTIKVFHIQTRWRTIISTYDPPYHFVDEQLKGPYSFWHHSHRFRQSGSGTIFSDEIHYVLPQYLPRLLRQLLHRWYVRPRLEQIFDFRKSQYQKYFSANNYLDSDLVANSSMENLSARYSNTTEDNSEDISARI